MTYHNSTPESICLSCMYMICEYMELNVYEFVKLGLSDPIPVSAMQGRGTGDLLDLVIADRFF